jgi:hypothetical protein
MSAIECAELQDIARGRLASQSCHLAESSILMPSPGKFCIDLKQTLSHENFKQTTNDFFKDKTISTLSQLPATSSDPTHHVLLEFASTKYTVYKKRETGAQYETRLALPDDWNLLMTVSKNGRKNGYFGAAYWHPEYQQNLNAQRDRKLNILGAIFTQVFCVVFENHVPQKGSASTFAHKVVELLREVNQEMGLILKCSHRKIFSGLSSHNHQYS